MRWPNGEVLQEWKGFVEEVGDETFWARLLDITAGAAIANEVAEIPIRDLKPRERELLRLGAYLKIRVRKDPDGVDIRFSRRRWTKREMERAESWASRTAKALNWE